MSIPDMPVPRRTTLPHEVPRWVPDGAVFFVTICCRHRGVNVLCQPETARVLLESVEFRVQRAHWWVDLFMIMPDHVHALVSFPREVRMRNVIFNWKEVTAKKTGVRWQRDFFDHRLRDARAFEEKAHYIRMNPVRQGLVTRCEDWPYVWVPPGLRK